MSVLMFTVSRSSKFKFSSRRVFTGAFFLILFVQLVIGLAGIGEEWLYHHHGWAGARRSINARNYLRFGYLKTKFAPLDNVGNVKSGKNKDVKMVKYWHHPPGFSVLLSVFFRLFGDSETTARSLSLLMSLASTIVVFVVFSRSEGEVTAVIASVFLTFIPIYAGYINFVNFEPLVILSMLLIILIYELYCENRKWWYYLVLFPAVFVSGFSDYPIYPFLFYIWVVIAISEFSKGIKNYKFPLIFALFVLAVSLIVLLQIKSMNEDLGSYKNLFIRRYSLSGSNPYLAVLEKWDYYLWFFNPVTIMFSGLWLFDFIVRLMLLRLKRSDGYIFALFLAAATYWLLIPQGAKIHEYAALYFCPPLALMSASGMFRFLRATTYGSKFIATFITLTLIAVFVITSVPHIYSKKICPIYEYVKPVHKLDSPKKYDFHLSYNILARALKRLTREDELVGIYKGFDIRPEFKYYLDRNYKIIKRRTELLRAERKKSVAFLLLNENATPSDVISYMLKRYRFIFFDHYIAFDIKKRLNQPWHLKKVFKKVSFLRRYLHSLITPPFQVCNCKWRVEDLALKIPVQNPSKVSKNLVHSEPPAMEFPFYKSIYLYNRDILQGKSADFTKISKFLTKKSGKNRIVFHHSIEFLGSRIERARDGRAHLYLLFSALKNINYNVYVELNATALHKDSSFVKELKLRTHAVNFIIPSSMWKSNLIYVAQSHLNLFPGPYEISFKLRTKDNYEVINDRNSSNEFNIKCSSLEGTNQLDILSEVTSEVTRHGDEGVDGGKDYMDLLKGKQLGDDFYLLGCISAPVSKNKWIVRFFFKALSTRKRNYTMNFQATGKIYKKKIRKNVSIGFAGGENLGGIFWVEEIVGDSINDASIKIVSTPKPPSVLTTSDGRKKISLGSGEYGIHFPLFWLY